MSVTDIDPNLALCTQVDPELFFPDPSDYRKAYYAKSVCAKCPVVAECLTVGLTFSHSESFGIWGGATQKDRQELRAGRRTKQFHLKELKEKYQDVQDKAGEKK